MKKHILSNFSKKCNCQKGRNYYYDELTQMSYKDRGFEIRITERNDPTMITESGEASDADEFNFQGSSIETRVIESSDPDEFYIN